MKVQVFVAQCFQYSANCSNICVASCIDTNVVLVGCVKNDRHTWTVRRAFRPFMNLSIPIFTEETGVALGLPGTSCFVGAVGGIVRYRCYIFISVWPLIPVCNIGSAELFGFICKRWFEGFTNNDVVSVTGPATRMRETARNHALAKDGFDTVTLYLAVQAENLKCYW